MRATHIIWFMWKKDSMSKLYHQVVIDLTSKHTYEDWCWFVLDFLSKSTLWTKALIQNHCDLFLKWLYSLHLFAIKRKLWFTSSDYQLRKNVWYPPLVLSILILGSFFRTIPSEAIWTDLSSGCGSNQPFFSFSPKSKAEPWEISAFVLLMVNTFLTVFQKKLFSQGHSVLTTNNSNWTNFNISDFFNSYK